MFQISVILVLNATIITRILVIPGLKKLIIAVELAVRVSLPELGTMYAALVSYNVLTIESASTSHYQNWQH